MPRTSQMPDHVASDNDSPRLHIYTPVSKSRIQYMLRTLHRRTILPSRTIRLIATMSTYKGELPSLTIDPRIPEFFEKFYTVSDNPSDESHTAYANSVTKKGTLMMGTRKAEGYDAILELRKGKYCDAVAFHSR